MPASIELERRLRWADSDAAGRLHFPRIFEIVGFNWFIMILFVSNSKLAEIVTST